jgi:hypothetical protein
MLAQRSEEEEEEVLGRNAIVSSTFANSTAHENISDTRSSSGISTKQFENDEELDPILSGYRNIAP